MPTDEERREVARRLRELPTNMYDVEELWEMKGLDTCCKDQTDYYLIHFALFECFPVDHMHPCDYEELHTRLADLIEPACDRDALLALSDELEEDACWEVQTPGNMSVARRLKDTCDRIREALGERS